MSGSTSAQLLIRSSQRLLLLGVAALLVARLGGAPAEKAAGTAAVASTLCAHGEPTVSEAEAALLKQAEALAARNPGQAAKLIQDAIAPESSPALSFAAGAFLFQDHQPRKAAAAFRRALRRCPNFARARLNLARVLLDLGKVEQAAGELAGLTTAPGVDHGTVWGLLGFALLSAGRNMAAETAYRNALVFCPAAAVRPGLIRSLLAQKRFEAARSALLRELDHSPDRLELWTLLASTDLARGENRDAMLHLECARRIGGLKPSELATLGDLMFEQGLILEAAAVFAKTATLEKAPVHRVLQAAHGFLLLGKTDQAAILLRKLRSSQELEASAEDRAQLRFLEGQLAEARGQTDDARETYDAVLEQDPLHAGALFALGDIEYRAGNLDRALLLYERAGRLPDSRARSLVRQARIAVERTHYTLAVRLLRRALESKADPAVREYLTQIQRLMQAANVDRSGGASAPDAD